MALNETVSIFTPNPFEQFAFTVEFNKQIASAPKVVVKPGKSYSLATPGHADSVAVFIQQDHVTRTFQMRIFAPYVIFNYLRRDLQFRSEVIPAGQTLYWAPSADAKRLKQSPINVGIPRLTKTKRITFTGSKFHRFDLEHGTDKHLCVPVRSSVIGFGPSTIATFSIYMEFLNRTGLHVVIVGQPSGASMTLDPDEQKSPEFFAVGGAVRDIWQFSIDDCLEPVLLQLSTPKREAFWVRTPDKTYCICADIVDTGITFLATFSQAQLLTPIMINNSSNFVVSTYQLGQVYNVTKIEPGSTGPFAWNRPLESHEMVLNIEDTTTTLSLVDDVYVITVEVSESLLNIACRVLPGGTKLIIVSPRDLRVKASHPLKFETTFSDVSISLFDIECREIAILSLMMPHIEINTQPDRTWFEASLDAIRLDDRNPTAMDTLILFGQKRGRFPFMKSQILFPSGVPLFSLLLFAELQLQPIKVNLNSQVFFDLANVTKQFAGKSVPNITHFSISHTIKKVRPIVITWLEISEIVILCEKSRSTRIAFYPHSRGSKVVDRIPFVGKTFQLPSVFLSNVEGDRAWVLSLLITHYRLPPFGELAQMRNITKLLLFKWGDPSGTPLEDTSGFNVAALLRVAGATPPILFRSVVEGKNLGDIFAEKIGTPVRRSFVGTRRISGEAIQQPQGFAPLTRAPRVPLVKAKNPDNAGFAQSAICRKHADDLLRVLIEGKNELVGLTDSRLYHLNAKREVDVEVLVTEANVGIAGPALVVKDRKDRVLISVEYGEEDVARRAVEFWEMRKIVLSVNGRC
jgi:hypothetical protein